MGCPSPQHPTTASAPNPQGTYEALATGKKHHLSTDALGGFEVPEPQLGLYRFSNALPGSACRDAITGATVRFPMALYVPPVTSTAITPIALLTVPAAEDPAVTRMYNGRPQDGRAPHYLWTQAYKLFGYNADELQARGAVLTGLGLARGATRAGGRAADL